MLFNDHDHSENLPTISSNCSQTESLQILEIKTCRLNRIIPNIPISNRLVYGEIELKYDYSMTLFSDVQSVHKINSFYILKRRYY